LAFVALLRAYRYIADMKSTLIFTSVVLIACAALPSLALADPHWGNDPIFLDKNAISIADVIAPAPAPNSSVDQADHQELLKLQSSRTPADCKRAGTEVHVSLETFFGPEYGPLKEAEVKKWTPFFDDIGTDAEFFSKQAKQKWKRLRPYLAYQDIKPCTPLEQSTSYPSGHATISRVYADVLSKLDPSRKELFMKRADQIAGDRVLAGVHHTSDIEAGKKLGDVEFAALMKNPQFEQALKKAQ
jgi:acid phosphatase (class A)